MEEQGSKHKKDESPPSANPSSLAAKLQSPITMLSYLVSLPVIAAAGWLMYMRNYDCEDILRMPGLRVGIGVSMIVVFLISNLVVFYGDRCLIAGFVLVMVPLVVMLTLGLAISGAYKAESQALPASPLWIRRRVANNHNWLKIKKCICDESRTCSNLAYKTAGFNLYDFRTKKLSLIEAGCCIPPPICGMDYVNATYWIDPTKPGLFPGKPRQSLKKPLPFFGGDCDTWSNIPARLCYDCQTCHEGFLRTIQRKWWRLGVFLIVISTLLIILHFLRFTLTMTLQHRDQN
ncbi:hypothetical protein MRB53_008984 [Persea americana]|uniref:Uncharacterized protein n=1 Tax=Persea americana TaxID=3435 RepID=A0ACC2LMU0_PERAE|nr:hypothetical protein MRB53_008984 [Persea americana]